MDPLLRRAFLLEIDQQIRQSVIATDLINEGIGPGAGDGEAPDPDRAWVGITALLAAADTISKILWPKLDRPRTALLDQLQVTAESPLADRTLRNHFERADHRIEQWWKTSPEHRLVETLIGPAPEAGDGYRGDWVRTFDPSTNVVTFHGDRIDLQALVLELERIAPQVRDG